MEREAAKQSGNEASQFFFMLILALLVSLTGETQPTPARIDFSIRSALALVGSRLRDYLAWYTSVNRLASFMQFRPRAVCLASLYSFHAVRAACKPFGQLPSHSVSFQAIRPAFKPFGLVSKRDHFATYY